jgi:hypothetical protein
VGEIVGLDGQSLSSDEPKPAEQPDNPLNKLGPQGIQAMIQSYLQGVAAALEFERDPVTFVAGSQQGSFVVTVTYFDATSPEQAMKEVGGEKEIQN